MVHYNLLHILMKNRYLTANEASLIMPTKAAAEVRNIYYTIITRTS